MSAKHVYELHCDADGCDRMFLGGLQRAGESRTAAREDGWVHITVPPPHRCGVWKSLDYCPTHAELGATKGAT